MALILGGLLGNMYDNYMEEKKSGRLARDAIAQLENDVYHATEMISVLEEARKEAEEKNLCLLHEVDNRKNNEAALTQRNDNLNNEMMKKMEEYEDALIRKGIEIDNLKEKLANKDQESQRDRVKLEEVQRQASDNDFYCGYLEEKVKAHEAERKRLKEVTTKLEDKLRASQLQTTVLPARILDQEKNHGKEAQRNLPVQKNVHTTEDRLQFLQKENENLNEKLSERGLEMASVNNSTVNEKDKNAALVEDNKALRDKITELTDQNGTLQKKARRRRRR
ncbi:ELKS/Rab6-interacting/CAST family member 1-like [Macrobrachium rosenbergii]|uniref:ELKS/Rab6-interacting/CAST family member 1-like n=1 Tax=Macrobrachium rosenbergii TaxID=79674 RepID=UPI0034D3E070